MAGYHFHQSGEKPPPYMYPFVLGHGPFVVQPHSLQNQFTWQQPQPFSGTRSARVLSDTCVMMSNCSVSGCPGDAQKTGNVKDVDDSVWEYLETQAACLGQSLWEKNELKMEYVDLDELLAGSCSASSVNCSPIDGQKTAPAANLPLYSSPSPISVRGNKCRGGSGSDSSAYDCAPAFLVQGAPKANKRAAAAASVASAAPQSQYTDSDEDDACDEEIPGADFDPKSRSFSEEELRPRRMSKKSKKQYVEDDLKDSKYWVRRRKNNLAAKRSRDARRAKENQIAMRASYLEKEVNAVLKTQLEEMTRLYEDAMRRLEKYEPATKKAKLQL